MERRTLAKLNDMIIIVKDTTLVCQNPHTFTIRNRGPFRNPFESSFPLLMFQLALISVMSHLINMCLQPLGQSIIVSQILGGMVVGPSMLGHRKEFALTLFPLRGTQVLETLATFGIIFFLFSLSVKMDSVIMLRPGRKAMTIGISVLFFTLALPILLALVLKKCLDMDATLNNALIHITASQALTGFPVIACLLDELKMLNTDIGRLALSVAMFCDVIGISLTALSFCLIGDQASGDHLRPLWIILSTAAFAGAIAFLCRPVIKLIISQTPEGKPVPELYIFTMFVLVLIVAVGGEIIGQHYIFGPLVLGLVVPDGPPLGSALSSKLEAISAGLLYPTYLAVSGLQTNVFKIHFQSLWIVGIIVGFSLMVKIGAAMLPAIYFHMPVREAFVLGLVLNAKGIIEISLYNLWKQSKILKDQEFALCIISVISVTAIITPLIKFLYNPSSRYRSVKRITIQHSKRDQELRILVCIYNQDSVPTIINLLDISHATEVSNVAVIILFLVELVGKTTPMLVAHQKSQKILESTASFSNHAVNAFKQYEIHNEGYAYVQSFTSISNWGTMHDDICRMAFDKRSTIVIVPFHKQWAIDGSIGSINRGIQHMNMNVLEKAPCSVGILVERGVLNRTMSVLAHQSPFHVAVIYFGGPDDAESLAYGVRMASHEHVDLTVVRFLLFGSENSKNRRRESDLIDEYRQAHVGNDRFVYAEEFARDGVGLAQSIRGMRDCFDLILVGRHHQESPLFVGLDQWSECHELGIIGDMLASADFGINASVLVVQQQRMANRNLQPGVFDREPLVHDVPQSEFSRSGKKHDLSYTSFV